VIHLGTSFLVDVLRETAGQREAAAARLLASIQDEELAISVFVACELSAGAAMSRKPAEEKRKVDRLCSNLRVDYPDERFPAAYGSLLARQQRDRGRISTMDLHIATSAIVAGAPLVTRNVKDFSRVADLEVLGY
jgi:predicted nucleic acid-binding protein